ncbi:MAG: hypothetical protein EU543_03955 [Promethearchaeota archaeon]|nr:MAG: hypothetical protein EU543_03955 [Candidatus Lokiarchaeota archaeon]
MIKQTSEKRRILIKKLLNAGINVTPNVLNFIMSTNNPSESLDLIIKETSFIPTFNSHLTIEFLEKISNQEIQKALRRAIRKNIVKDSKKLVNIKEKKENQNRKNLKEEINKENSSKNPKSFNKSVPNEKEIVNSTNFTSSSKNIEANKISSTLMIEKQSKQQSDIKKSKKKVMISDKIKKMSPAISEFDFKPVAKEYDFDYNIKMDPTGKLFTSGEYDDFYNLNIDKFNQLYQLMRKRPETQSTINIGNILKFSEKSEVSTIGLVNEYRKTKNGHYFIVLEDLTGLINVLVRKDSEFKDVINTAKTIINDQMLYVQGEYNPGKQGNEGIIFASVISKIDIPTGLKPNLSLDPLSIILISDTHIGSREFEEKLWNKMIDFLNGNLGNKNLRETAGKVKYIIINGDLVDGIGVYPNQQEDLIIGDIYKQYEKAASLISKIPNYIKIFYSSGNHEPVRNAIPRPGVPKKYCQTLIDIGVKIVGNPCIIETNSVETLVFHGDSLLDLNLLIPGLKNEKPVDSMKELLKCRHLAPAYGNKTQIAPIENDWLVIKEIPQIFHTGHLHINGLGSYRNVQLVNSGCFQTQTDYMKSFGITPTPGRIPLFELNSLNSFELDLNKLS